MHKSRSRLVLLGVSCLALVAGCEDIDSRIQEKSAAFNQLSPEGQTRIRSQNVANGDSADLVYVALGRPNATERADTAKGPVEIWVYKNMPSTSPIISIAHNVAGGRFQGARESVLAPRNDKSLSNTSGGPAPSMDVSDTATHTLYVGLLNGNVVRLSLEPIDPRLL